MIPTMRRMAIALLLFALGCVATTSVTRTGTGLFAPREKPAEEEEEEEPPRGLSLSVGSIARDGTVILELRNYSMEPFVFAGAPDRPRLVIEVQSGNSQSRHTVSPWTRTKTHQVPAGERIELKSNISGLSGRVRIGVRSQEFGFVVWTNWIAL